jgi:hypothetical protein
MSAGRGLEALEVERESVKSEASRRKWAVRVKAGRGGGVGRESCVVSSDESQMGETTRERVDWRWVLMAVWIWRSEVVVAGGMLGGRGCGKWWFS